MRQDKHQNVSSWRGRLAAGGALPRHVRHGGASSSTEPQPQATYVTDSARQQSRYKSTKHSIKEDRRLRDRPAKFITPGQAGGDGNTNLTDL